MSYNIAGLYVIGIPYKIDKKYDYYIPEHMTRVIEIGSVVAVPFGVSNKKRYAVVCELKQSETRRDLKPIFSVETDYVLDEDDLKLCAYMKNQYFCSFGDAVKCLFPSAVFSRIREVYTAREDISYLPKLSAKALAIYDTVLTAGKINRDILIQKYGYEISDLLDALSIIGYLDKHTESSEKNILSVEMVSLVDDIDSANRILIEGKMIKGVQQLNVYSHLIKNGDTSFHDLHGIYGVSKQTVKSLENKKLVIIEKREISRSPYKAERIVKDDYDLTSEQQRVSDRISEIIDSGNSHAVLLHGVTGSGKTAVIKKAIDKVLSVGKKVIMLVPEIALTPQAISVFCSYYGDRIALVHSSLSEGERYDAWRRMKRGEADICIGTRSAIFAPFKNIGLIVIDEEQEHTYKSDMTPKYHARDIARYRCAHENALLLLSSATPSVESYYKAEKGIYELLKLTERYNNQPLPQTIIHDMRTEATQGSTDLLGTVMRDSLKKTLDSKEQAILFVNRRGYNNFVSCPLCGNVEKCERCSVSYTYHSYGKRGEKKGCLVCHYCGSRKPAPKVCPNCGNDRLSYNGFGTQKAEESVGEDFPEARILRMDADTTGSKYAFDRMLESFRNKEYDLLLGTQMVSKGHDFPDVTLVGVLSADNSLYLEDFRASEQTFSLLTQVIGRSGRSNKPGIAIIQTYNPTHPVIRYAAAQDYDAFYKNEIAIRKNYVFPPFCDIAVITFSTTEESMFKGIFTQFSKMLSELSKGEYKDVKFLIFGPFEAPLYKFNNYYRMRYIFKCKNNSRTRAFLSELYLSLAANESSKLSVSIDINPSNI